MINIQKGKEPEVLTLYRAIPDADWDGPATEDGLTFSDVKEELRRFLYAEQRGLCAYCMCKLGTPTALSVKIEHFFPRSKSTGTLACKKLEYANLLLCCCGRVHEGLQSNKEITCDTAKGDKVLEMLPNPAVSDVQSSIHYSSEGTLQAPDEWAADIALLNLNCRSLIGARLQAKNSFIKCFCHADKYGKSAKSKAYYAKLLQQMSTINMPYLGIILDLLKNKVKS